MTFWGDAPRLRIQPVRRRRRRRGRMVAAVAAVIGVLVVTAVRPERAMPSPAPRVEHRVREMRLTPRWTRSLPFEPAYAARQGDDVVVATTGTVSAVGIASGQVRWSTRVDGAEEWADVDGHSVILAASGRFVALSASDGAPRWSVPSAEGVGPVALGTTADAARVAAVATEDGMLAVLGADDGVTRWAVREAGMIIAAPVVRASVVAAVWSESDRAVLRVFDAISGAKRWERVVPMFHSTPAVWRDRVVIGAGDGSYASHVHAFASEDGRELWRAAAVASFQPDVSPAIAGTTTYLVDQLGHVAAYDLGDGARRWSRDLRAAVLAGQPQPFGARLGVMTEDAELVLLDRRSGRLIARIVPPGFPVAVVLGARRITIAQRGTAAAQLQGFSGLPVPYATGSPR